MRITVANIEDLQTRGELKRLATFLFLKELYKNSCIFNYSIKSLAKKSGLSRHKVRQNINYFVENGWVRFHNKNLILCKNFATAKETGEWIIRKKEMFKGKSIKEICVILLSLCLKQKEKQFSWIQKIKHDLGKRNTNEAITLKDWKRALKAKAKYRITENGESESFKMTMEKIGELFNISRRAVSDLVKQWEKLNLVRVTRYYPEWKCFATNKAKISYKDFPGLFLCHNVIWEAKCNEYSFF